MKAKHITDFAYPLEKILYLSKAMMMLGPSEFETSEADDDYYDFFLAIHKNAKEAREKLKEIENGNTTKSWEIIRKLEEKQWEQTQAQDELSGSSWGIKKASN